MKEKPDTQVKVIFEIPLLTKAKESIGLGSTAEQIETATWKQVRIFRVAGTPQRQELTEDSFSAKLIFGKTSH